MSWCSEKVIGKITRKTGKGLFARQAIAPGETLVVWDGLLVSINEYRHAGGPVLAAQVEDGLVLTTVNEGPGDWINHCCDPNVGIRGQVTLVAIRNIEAGEELRYDYAFTDSESFDEFECHCGSTDCRGKVTGCDWTLPELQLRYHDYFSDYLKRRMVSAAMISEDDEAEKILDLETIAT